MEDEIWVDKFGRTMPMSDMTVLHLKQALRTFIRKRSTCTDGFKQDINDRIKKLKRELKRRNLTMDILND